jgi:hypothetical protein
MSEDPDITTEEWTYTGLICDSDGKRVTEWLRPFGNEAWFNEARASYVLGGIYTVKIKLSPTGNVRRVGDPVYTGRRVPEELRRQWVARNLGAENRLATLARERKHKGEDPLDKAMEPLIALAATTRTWQSRDALAAGIIRRLHQAWGTK